MNDARMTPAIWAGIGTALSCGLIAAVGIAINAPLFALTLDDAGLSATEVGFLMTFAGLAGLLCTPLVPWLMGRLPIKMVLGGGLLASSLMFLLYPTTDNIWVWTAIRFGFSTSLTIIFVASEAWFLELAPAHLRGRLLGLYAATFAGGFGIGGFIIAQLGHQGPATPYAGALIMAAATLPLFVLKAPSATRPEGDEAKPGALLARLMIAPALFVPAFAMGAIETSAFNLFPLWVRQVGFEDAAAGYLIAASGLGNILLQGPIGILADRYGRTRTLLSVAVIGFIGPFLLMMVTAPVQAYAICFVWSGCVTGFYTLGLMGLAERFGKGELAGANAAYGGSYGVGQLIAPLAGGTLLQSLGPAGFMAGLACMALTPILAIGLQFHAQRKS